ncbi:hypothetical protein ACE01N_02605 [Saccharicrinis sp. FJH2]|uniref:hypothetical protein n=1 Tax=Saccharicrinis sp. FJH65 TaxID=3344659 RepID=UPI0035F3D782
MKRNKILYLDASETIYTRAIVDELNLIFSSVDCFFYEEIYRHPIFKGRFFDKDKASNLRDQHLNNFLNYIKANKYDIILVKAPFNLPVSFFQKLRSQFKSVPIINYNWSSIKKFNFLPYKEIFTKVYSFDREDCEKENLEYYPLFFLKQFDTISQNAHKKIYDVSFIGSGYSPGRLEFLNNFVNTKEFNTHNIYLYIYTPQKLKSLKVYFRYKKLRDHCYWHQLSSNGLFNITAQSLSMIDHPMTIQTGLTIRTFETLGAGLHLFTTNLKIKEEPFYDSNRITIIDTDFNNFDFQIPIKNNVDWSEHFLQYRIDSWIKHITKI